MTGKLRVGTVSLLLTLLGGACVAAERPEPEPGAAPTEASPTAPTPAPSTGPEEEVAAFRPGPDPSALAPEIVPDDSTFYLTRGQLPSPLLAETALDRASTLSVEVWCEGPGTFELSVEAGDGSYSVPPVPECDGLGEGRASAELGSFDPATEFGFTFGGADGVTFVVEVRHSAE